MSSNLVDILKAEATTAYEAGSPIIPDEVFDILADSGIESVDPRNFRKPVELEIMMGSLSKKKTAQDVNDWAVGSPMDTYFISPKLDGNSIELMYRNGILKRAATRGDGKIGNDITEAIMLTNVKKVIDDAPGTTIMRCEAILPQSEQKNYEKSIRNVCSGAINAKTLDPILLKKIHIIAFRVIRSNINKLDEMYCWAECRDVMVVPHWTIRGATGEQLRCIAEEILGKLRDEKNEAFYYDFRLDGMVAERIADINEQIRHEMEKRPTHMVALKFKSETASSNVNEIEWNIGKHGVLTPVLVFNPPVELLSTSVSRCSAYNYALLKSTRMGIGAEVELTKSGDIIPVPIAVIEPSDEGLENLPDCPECGTPSERVGVHAVCPNKSCPGRGLVEIQKVFSDVIAIDFIGPGLIKKIFKSGRRTLHDVVAITYSDLMQLEGIGESTAKHYVDAMSKLELTEVQVLKAATVKNLSTSNATKLLDHYGSIHGMAAAIMKCGGHLDKIYGLGESMERELCNRDTLDEIVELMTNLKEAGVEILPHQKASDGIEVCRTGAWSGGTRKVLDKKLADLGFKVVDGVGQNTKYLLTDDVTSTSSKMKKAAKYGTRVMTYEQFFAEAVA